jgi:type IV pilus assembly protein PilC
MPRVELSALIPWTRALKHGLDIGLSPVKILRQQARIGPGSLRVASERMAEHLEKGESLTDAIAESGVGLPTLFREIVGMAEQAGRLPDALGELERHYEAVLSARKQFRTALIWPAISYILAIAVIALLIFIYDAMGRKESIVFGLQGISGAITVLVLGYGVALVAVLAYRTAMSSDDIQGAFQSFALNIPGLAGCARAVALSRFTMAYHMLAEAGMPADKVVKASLKATTNTAYRRHADLSAKLLRKGEEVSEVLGPLGERLFPSDFMQVVALGEETGNLAELMHKQSKHYAEEAARKMSFLAKLAGGVVYAMIAVFIIVMILNIFLGPVSQPYRDAFDAVDNPEKWLRGGN